MSWWGKVIGGAFGFMLGGPLGALLGAALGHNFDKGLDGLGGGAFESSPFGGMSGANQERIQAAFFTATFSVMGNLAKADGHVSRSEIDMASLTMDKMGLSAEQKKIAIELFNQGKSPEFDLQAVMSQFRRECQRRSNLIQMFMEIQLAVALADGELHASEQALLFRVAELVGFSRRQFEQLLAMVVAQQRFSRQQGGAQDYASTSVDELQQAYQVLGLERSASDQEIKKAYRRLISQHHPDKLVSKGLPEEMMKLATEKTRKIKEAYELIKHSRSRRN